MPEAFVSSNDELQRWVLERDKPLSTSLLWQCQRRFCTERARAVNDELAHETSSPRLADAYARVLLGHLRDRARAGSTARTYVVELGAGSGRFAHHLLARLLPRVDALGLDAPFTYVLTDIAPGLLASWRSHPRLRAYVARGVLDFALHDATTDAPLVLVESGATLDRSTLEAPLVVIANAVFSALPVDCFRVEDGELAAGLITLSLPAEVSDPTEPHHLPAFALDVTTDPVGPSCYGDPVLDAILARYRERLDDTAFLFPVAALRCVAHLRARAPGLLALIADRGLLDEEGLRGRAEPELALHGSMSTLLNFDALAAYAHATGGRIYQAMDARNRLDVVGLALDLPAAPETACAFDDAFDLDSPIDGLDVASAIAHAYEQCSLAELLAHLRAAHADPHVFWRCYPSLVDRVADASMRARRDTAQLLARVWETHFSVDEAEDLALAIASVHHAMGEHDDACWYAEQSIRERGATPLARFQLAKCYRALGDHDAARDQLAHILAAEPGFEPAQRLGESLDAQAAHAVGRLA